MYCTQQIIQHKHFNTLQAPARFPDDEWAELFSVYLLRLCIWFGGVAFFVDTWKNEFPCLRLIPGVWFLRPLISCVEPLGRVSMGLTSHFIDLRISQVNGFFYPFFWFRVSRYIEFLGPERYSDKVVHFTTCLNVLLFRIWILTKAKSGNTFIGQISGWCIEFLELYISCSGLYDRRRNVCVYLTYKCVLYELI